MGHILPQKSCGPISAEGVYICLSCITTKTYLKTYSSQAEAELGCLVSVGYGMTENTCGTFLTPLGDVPEITTKTVGYPIPGCNGKVIDPETEEILEEGQIGELCTKGFMVFQGYVGDPEKTAESYTKDGWWKTGDLAVIENGVTR